MSETKKRIPDSGNTVGHIILNAQWMAYHTQNIKIQKAEVRGQM